MSRFLLLWFAAAGCIAMLLAGAGTSQAQKPDNKRPTSSEKLTVMTWNLEWFYDEIATDNVSKLAKEKTAPNRPAWAWRRDAVAASIDKVRPTILALQEIESRRILWYLTKSLERNHSPKYQELGIESGDHFTEQDVGMLFRQPADVLSISQLMQTRAMFDTKRYYDVSKHLLAVFQFPVGKDAFERVMVMNVHFRSRAEGAELRLRQARLVHHWLKDSIARGEHVIVLGDTNTEERGNTTRRGSDLAVLCGYETPSADDDLVDLHLKLSPDQRQTHLLTGKQFDRILVSPSLLKDDPARPDLVFESIEVLPQLAIQGERDDPDQHWQQYWKLPASERDLSDHFPVLATFGVR